MVMTIYRQKYKRSGEGRVKGATSAFAPAHRIVAASATAVFGSVGLGIDVDGGCGWVGYSESDRRVGLRDLVDDEVSWTSFSTIFSPARL